MRTVPVGRKRGVSEQASGSSLTLQWFDISDKVNWLNYSVTTYYRLAVSPSKFIYEVLTPNLMVFGGRAFGRYLGHESRALVNGISARIEDLESFLGPSIT